MDTRRGLYSYDALRSRLAENSFAVGGLADYTGPVLRLANLTPEDMYVLLGKLRHVYAGGDPSRYLVPDEALPAFMDHCAHRIGDAYFRTPRTTVKEFLNLLAVLDQNPGADWRALVGQIELATEPNPDLEPLPEDAAPCARARDRPAVRAATPTMSSALSASNGPDAASQAFDLLAEPVRRWVYDQGWQTLRDAQEAAIPVLLAGTADVIIAAATAAGKTEAAFLPICSRLASDPAPGPGARVLYVAPLKALINDQYDRLSGLCERLEIPVHRWHGDVPGL